MDFLISLRSKDPSTLTLHILHPSPLLPLLLQTSFSPSLTHLTSHPPILLTHISSEYLTPPPPLSTPEKFWGVFIPIRERGYESERLMFGPGGEGGSGGGGGEFVVEILVRGGGEGRRRAVERVLEGWSSTRGGACELNTLDSLKNIFSKKKAIEEVILLLTYRGIFRTDCRFSRLHQTPHRMYHSTSTSPLPNRNPEPKYHCRMLMKVQPTHRLLMEPY